MMIKVYLLGLLLGVAAAAVGAAEDPPCVDEWLAEECERRLNNGYCTRLGVRHFCRKTCDVCDSYENPRPQDEIAVMYGGNHVLTWDRLPFDNTAEGEIVLYTNSRTGMKVHSLSIRPAGIRTSVTTAVAAIGSTGECKLQIAVDRRASSDAREVGQCKLLFSIGNQPLPKRLVEQLAGYRGIAQVPRIFEEFAYKLELRSGARVEVSLRHGVKQGCYFDRIQVMLTESLRRNTTGLLGTPDNNIYNDWQRRDGSFTRIPADRPGRYFAAAYKYAQSQWCVKFWGDSIIRYYLLGSFNRNMKCNKPYGGFTNFNSASPEISRICGAFNMECLHDALSTSLASEGAYTNVLMEEVEIYTVPESEGISDTATETEFLSEGLNIQPRGIAADQPSTMKATVSLKRLVPGLHGFGLFVLNERSLQRTERVVGFLTDDGDSGKGDVRQFDGVFTDLFTVALENGHSMGLAAVPFIRGVYNFDMPELTFLLPAAVRGYSPESTRETLSEGNRAVHLNTIAHISVAVKYLWTEQDTRAIGGVRFLGKSAGTQCAGGSGPYIECDCNRNGMGEFAEADVAVGAAFRDNKFTAFTVISLYGHRLAGRGGSGKVAISIRVKRNGKEASFLSMSVQPPTAQRLCPINPSDHSSSHLGDLTIRVTDSGVWILELSES